MTDIALLYQIHIHLVVQLLLQGGYPPVRESARMDVPEIVQLCVDIQGKSMHRHEMRTAYSDCTYFA